MSIEVLFSPAEFAVLAQRDLSQTTCVVFDVLRATSSMLTALANGAVAILPVSEIAEALALRRIRPEVLLGGERDGFRIRAEQTGGVDFDLGNSPREFTAKNVQGKTIVMCTTNGTRALRACASAETTLVGSLLNLEAVARRLESHAVQHLLLICSGTFDQVAAEDVLAAGGLCHRLRTAYGSAAMTDSAEIARQFYCASEPDLVGAVQRSRNGRRLLAIPEFRDDVRVCAQRDSLSFVAGLNPAGEVRRWESQRKADR